MFNPRKFLVGATWLVGAMAAQSAPVLLNNSFETNNVVIGYKYAGTVNASPWIFSGGSGVSRDGGAWQGDAPYSEEFAFLQNVSSIAQTFASDGSYNIDLSFYLAERPNYSPNQTVDVLMDGVSLLGTNVIDPDSRLWVEFKVSTLIDVGAHTLTFKGLATSGDNTVFLDEISMKTTALQVNQAVPEPATYVLLGMGLVALSIGRKYTKVF